MTERMMLEIRGQEANIRFSSAHFILHHEKCEHLHGHTYFIDVRVHGLPDESGMIIDFDRLKSTLREIAEHLDHRLILPSLGPASIHRDGNEVIVRYNDRRYVIPADDVVILDVPSVTAENLASYALCTLLEEIRPDRRITCLEVSVSEGPGQRAWAVWRR